MRLIFVTLGYHPDSVGGAYRYIADLAERLASRGHDVSVIYPVAAGMSLEQDTLNGVKRLRYQDAEGMFFANWNTENRNARVLWLQATRYGNEPALTIICHAFFAPLLHVAGPNSLFLFTGPWAEEYRFAQQARELGMGRKALDVVIRRTMRISEGQALRRCRAIVTISQYYQRELPQWHGEGLPPVRVIFGGVDLQRFHPPADRAAVRARWKLADGDFLFLTVRRLDPRMGLANLIRAFASVALNYPNARLWLAGKGPEAPALEALIRELKLEHHVRLLGFVPEADLPSLYAAADCTLMPSLDLEGFGLATVESLACGTPVMGTRSGATPELLEPLAPGLLFEPGDLAGLTQRLEKVMQNPVALPARDKCRAYAEERFSWDLPVDKFQTLLKQLTEVV
jgi:glycosyltransferase involved in cell wall biosynthesis